MIEHTVSPIAEAVGIKVDQPAVPRDKQMKRQSYKCRCGNISVQDNYMPDEQPLPALACGKCHGGQGMDMATQLHRGLGLIATGTAELYTL